MQQFIINLICTILPEKSLIEVEVPAKISYNIIILILIYNSEVIYIFYCSFCTLT